MVAPPRTPGSIAPGGAWAQAGETTSTTSHTARHMNSARPTWSRRLKAPPSAQLPPGLGFEKGKSNLTQGPSGQPARTPEKPENPKQIHRPGPGASDRPSQTPRSTLE